LVPGEWWPVAAVSRGTTTWDGPCTRLPSNPSVKSAEKSATRYALDHLRLRGSDGQIAATDGRQALVQTKFTFPWEELLLSQASPRFTAKESHKFDLVKVGRTEVWVTFQIGPWTILLKINHEARLPNLDDCIPDPSQAVTKL